MLEAGLQRKGLSIYLPLMLLVRPNLSLDLFTSISFVLLWIDGLTLVNDLLVQIAVSGSIISPSDMIQMMILQFLWGKSQCVFLSNSSQNYGDSWVLSISLLLKCLYGCFSFSSLFLCFS
ncbi:MAG: hypothetical protein D6732_14840 [Methanobacteriota archaeon]|nr:MAG: hypothetical protein D6732_14840 [Euryarchaeota archaeon]